MSESILTPAEALTLAKARVVLETLKQRASASKLPARSSPLDAYMLGKAEQAFYVAENAVFDALNVLSAWFGRPSADEAARELAELTIVAHPALAGFHEPSDRSREAAAELHLRVGEAQREEERAARAPVQS